MAWARFSHPPAIGRCLRAGLTACAAGWLVLAAQGASAAGSKPTAFIRYRADTNGNARLETAIRSYADGLGRTVALLSVVHVGDAAYFERLQERGDACDALLYEMIREPGAPAKVEMDNPVSQLQLGIKSLLGLEFQLERIDYTRTNFVHADLDPDTFARLQDERNESILGLMLRAVLEEQNRTRAGGDGRAPGLDSFQLLRALLSPDRGDSLKRLLGPQMAELESTVAGIDRTPDGKGSVLVSARNARVMEVFREQLRLGKRRVGILFGAGHMADLEKRLQAAGFRAVGDEWLTAWDLPAPSPPADAASPAREAGPAQPGGGRAH